MTKEEDCVADFLSYIRKNAAPENIVAQLSKKYDVNILASSIIKAYENYYEAKHKAVDKTQGGYAQKIRELDKERRDKVGKAMNALQQL
jgi:hypothetical protein